jgi:hypothetical protein
MRVVRFWVASKKYYAKIMGPWFRFNYPGLGSKKRSFLSKFFWPSKQIEVLPNITYQKKKEVLKEIIIISYQPFLVYLMRAMIIVITV